MQKYYVRNVHCTLSMSQVEQRLSTLARMKLGYVLDRPALLSFVQELKDAQAGILAQHPRLKAVHIEIIERYSTLICMGEAYVAFDEVKGEIYMGEAE